MGSHGVVENATGTTCEQDIDYYPYGGVEHDYCPNVAQNYKFNGKERDAESGLDNFGARFDASSLGRFMTPDWAAKPVTVPYAKFGDPQSLNLYSYVENGPVNRIDADGHVEWAPQLDFSGGPIDIGGATAEAAGGGGGMAGVPYSETIMPDSVLQAQKNQTATPKPKGEQKTKGPPNSRTDVVLYPAGNATPKGNIETLYWLMDWLVGTCSGTDCHQTRDIISGVENDPSKPGVRSIGDAKPGEVTDRYSREARTVTQWWSAGGKRVQVLIPTGDGRYALTWVVNVVIHGGYNQAPTFSPGPAGEPSN